MDRSITLSNLIPSTLVGLQAASALVTVASFGREFALLSPLALNPVSAAFLIGIPTFLGRMSHTEETGKYLPFVWVGSFAAIHTATLYVPALAAFAIPSIPAVSAFAIGFFALIAIQIGEREANLRLGSLQAASFAITAGTLIARTSAAFVAVALQPATAGLLAGIPYVISGFAKDNNPIKKAALGIGSFALLQAATVYIPALNPFALPLVPAISVVALGILTAKAYQINV